MSHLTIYLATTHRQCEQQPDHMISLKDRGNLGRL